jgi:hypothetical protein
MVGHRPLVNASQGQRFRLLQQAIKFVADGMDLGFAIGRGDRCQHPANAVDQFSISNDGLVVEVGHPLGVEVGIHGGQDCADSAQAADDQGAGKVALRRGKRRGPGHCRQDDGRDAEGQVHLAVPKFRQLMQGLVDGGTLLPRQKQPFLFRGPCPHFMFYLYRYTKRRLVDPALRILGQGKQRMVELFTDIEWQELLTFDAPSKNASGDNSFSIHLTRVKKIQLGEYDEFEKNKIVRLYKNEGIELQCSRDVIAWVRELEQQVLLCVEKNSSSWFGTHIGKEELRTMFKPMITSFGTVVLRFEQNMRVYKMNNTCTEAKKAPRNGLAEGMMTLPIVRIKGLWLKNEFGLCVSISDMLLFEEPEPENPFLKKEELHNDSFYRPPSPVESFLSHGKSLHGDDFVFPEK